MPTKTDSLNPQMQAILACLSDTQPMDMYTVAEQLGLTYWGVYPYFRKLEEIGLIRAGVFRTDKKKTYLLADLSGTPKLRMAGNNSAPVPIYKIATGAPTALKKGTEAGILINGFPYMLLRLYNLAASVQAGHPFDKETYHSIRKDMVGLRVRLENLLMALNEMIAHPAFSGSPNILVDSLMSDPQNPLDRETIARLMKECE
jgi:hypothetical protein